MMDTNELSVLSHMVQSGINSSFKKIIEPTIRTAISGLTMIQAGKLKAVGGTISRLELANKTAMATKLILNRYVSSVVAAIDVVVLAQQLKELDRDRLTAELNIEDLKPKLKTILKRNIESIDFGETSGLISEVIKQVKKIGTDALIDAVMELLPT